MNPGRKSQQSTAHRTRPRRILSVVVGLVLFLLLAALGWSLSPRYAANAGAHTAIQELVARQEQIEQDLRTYYQSGSFTFNAPLVIQDPYQRAPLTALLIFDTPEDSQVSVQVPGRGRGTGVETTLPGYRRHHEIPVYGLYAGMLNQVTLSFVTLQGDSGQTTVDLQTEALPVYLQSLEIATLDLERYSPGFNFTSLEHKPVYDLEGAVRWYSTQRSWEVFTPLKNGHFLFTYTEGEVEGNILTEEDLLGRIYAIYEVPDGIHHDVIELPSGNLLLTSSDLGSDTIEDTLLELDRASGHWRRWIDLKETLDPGRPRQVEGLADGDWLHLNSLAYDDSDGTIILSSKGQSAVIKLSYPGLKIQWILGPHDNWSQKFQPYLLSPLGEDFTWSWSQHHATLYGSRTAGEARLELLLFDNGLYRSFESADAYDPQDWYSRVVHYEIDEDNLTVSQTWEYGQSRGAGLFSALRGSAYLLPNGNVLGTWGDIYQDADGNPLVQSGEGVRQETRLIEVDPVSGEVVFEGSLPGAETYRILRAGFYENLSEATPSLQTPLNNTSGNDLWDRAALVLRDVKRWTITPLIAWLKDLYHLAGG